MLPIKAFRVPDKCMHTCLFQVTFNLLSCLTFTECPSLAEMTRVKKYLQFDK